MPGKGSSAAGVKIRTRAVPPSSAGRTNVVSEKPISRASACIVPASSSRASVKTASWFPASARSVKTSTTTKRRVDTSPTLSRLRPNIVESWPAQSSCVTSQSRTTASRPSVGSASRSPRARSSDFGPNGAGKTTTVEILEGYRLRDGGDASVLGHDPETPARATRAHRCRPSAVGERSAPHRARGSPPLRRLLRQSA